MNSPTVRPTRSTIRSPRSGYGPNGCSSGPPDESTRTSLATIVAATRRAHGMLANLMETADPPPPTVGPVDLAAVVDAVVARLPALFPERLPPVRTRTIADVPTVAADGDQTAVLMANLLQNAVEATQRRDDRRLPEITVTLGRAVFGRRTGPAIERPAGDPDGPTPDWPRRLVAGVGERTYGLVIVRDAGPGMTLRERRHAFDPYFSGREAGRGHGFGLTRCRRIVDAVGGEILLVTADPVSTDDRADDREGEGDSAGVAVWVLLPAAA